MRATLANLGEQLRTSLWFIPAACVAGAFVLSTALLLLDAHFPDLEKRVPWVFGGTPDSARTLLQTVATSVITVVSIAFSVTLIALQQAASRYTPRVLQTFRRDRRNHVVLGTYIGTFAYALLILRQVRTEDANGGAFVPAASITTAILLALLSLGMLVYFIHHIVQALEVSWIVSSIGDDLHASFMHLFPKGFGEPIPAGEPDAAAARSHEGPERADVLAVVGGYLRRIDERTLSAAARGTRMVEVHRRIGDYVLRGARLATLHAEQPPGEGVLDGVREAFVFGLERSSEQDPLFGIRQLVDIAVKALSPGVNDPATAEEALVELGQAIATLLERNIPSPLRRIDGDRVYVFERPSFEDFVDACFSQLRRAARNDFHVTMSLLALLDELIARATDERRAPLRAQLHGVLDGLAVTDLPETDRETIRRRVATIANGSRAPRALSRRPAS